MELYEKIALYRKKSGLSQEALAEKIGVSRQAVSKWETGDALPEVTKLKLLAETFNVTVDFLLDEAQIEYSPQNKQESRSLLDRYLDGVEKFSDKAFVKLGALFQKYGWICGIFLILFGVYRILFSVVSFSTIAQIGSVGAAVGLPVFITVLFQVIIGIAFVVVGAVVIKKFKPKKADK